MTTADPPPPVRIAGLCGSLRAGSLNAAVLATAGRLLGPRGALTIHQGLDRLPFFNPDVEAGEPPRAVRELRALLSGADAVLITAPEYAHGMSGVLKNALEWSVGSGDFLDKPTAVITASPSLTGGDRAQAWTRETLEVMGAALLPPLAIDRAGARIGGGEVHDEAVRSAIGALLDELVAAVRAAAPS